MANQAVIDLLKTLRVQFPRHFADDAYFQKWESQYQKSLGHLSFEQLGQAYEACMDGWTKRNSAPLPGDLLNAFRARNARSSHDYVNGQETGEEFMARLRRKDRDRSNDRQRIIEEHASANRGLYEMARIERWDGLMKIVVERTAGMIAQRNEKRRAGDFVPEWRTPRIEEEMPFFAITTIHGIDLIDIGERQIEAWREMMRTPPTEEFLRAYPNRRTRNAADSAVNNLIRGAA